jgi:hypothetical protein
VTLQGPATFGGGYVLVHYTAGKSAQDQLGIASVGGISRSGANIFYQGTDIGDVVGSVNGVNGKDLRIKLDADATRDAVEALVEALTYRNTSDTPKLTRTVTITVHDGVESTAPAASVIQVAAENDAPRITARDAVTYLQGQIVRFLGAQRISVFDPDAGAAPIAVTLSVNHGALSIAKSYSVLLGGGSHLEQQTLTLHGTVAEINLALSTLSYRPNSVGSATLAITVDDLGNLPGPALQATDAIELVARARDARGTRYG